MIGYTHWYEVKVYPEFTALTRNGEPLNKSYKDLHGALKAIASFESKFTTDRDFTVTIEHPSVN